MSKILKTVKKVVKKVGPIVSPLYDAATGGKGIALKAATAILAPMAIGAVAPSLGASLGSGIANSVGSFAGNTLLSSLTGGFSGTSNVKSSSESPSAPRPAPFKPARSTEETLPSGLSGLASFTPEQQGTNLATQGVYGGGLGPEEQGYFQNLINRRLVDDSGNVDENFNDISPIEMSYLSQAGYGGYNNPKSLLEALSKWKNPNTSLS